MTLNEVIAQIHEAGHVKSAEGRNALHGATAGHPWCKGKSLEQRKLEVLFVTAGRAMNFNDKVRRASE